MNRGFTTGLVLLLALVGCAPAPDGSAFSLTPLRASSVQTVELLVRAPAALASNGRLLSDLGAGLIGNNGGHLLSDLGAGLVQRYPSAFGLLAAPAEDAPVGQAAVELRTLDGRPVSKAVLADDEGRVRLSAPGQKPLTAVALFGTGGKVYRLAAIVTPSDAPMPFFVDAINTLVEARIRPMLAEREGDPGVSFDKLKQVWMICNEAGVTVAPADLETNRSDAEVLARLREVWAEALTRVDQSDAAVIQEFLDSLGAEE